MVDYIKHCVDQIVSMEIQACVANPLVLDLEAYADECFRNKWFAESMERKARSEWGYLIPDVAGYLRFTEEEMQNIVRRALANVKGRYLLLAQTFRDVLYRWIWEKIETDISYKQLVNLVTSMRRDEFRSGFASFIQKSVQRYTPTPRAATNVQGILLSKKKLTADDIRRTKDKLERGETDTNDVLNTGSAMADRVFGTMFTREQLVSFFDTKHATILATHKGKVVSTADVVLYSWILCYLQKQIFASGYSRYTHVVCDEAQDMSPLFFDLLTRIYGRADFTLYGDMNQNILNYGAQTDWQENYPPITAQHRELFQLRHTYRSTAEIIEYATTILQEGRFLDGAPAIPIVKSGIVPREIRYTGVSELATLLVGLVADHEGQSMAIIAKKKTTAEGLQTLLTREIGSRTPNFEQKCKFISVSEAKGLEYDVVFLANADASSYPADLLHARLMYVAATRAAKQLCVVRRGAQPAAWVGGMMCCG